MLVATTALEFVAMFVFLLIVFAKPNKSLQTYWIALITCGAFYSMFYAHIVAERLRNFFCTRYEASIQGYATLWTEVLGLDDAAIKRMGKWNPETWKTCLNEDLGKGAIKYVWKLVWSQPEDAHGSGSSKEALQNQCC